MVGVTWKGARGRPSLPDLRAVSQPPQQRPEQMKPTKPPVSFKDKEAYQELFKPLPKPEPIPALSPVKVEAKSWRQLQEERERMVNWEIERTKAEAEDMWNRVKNEDKKRLNSIQQERNRIEEEYKAREALMLKEKKEREHKDIARKESIRRQEELLHGRKTRAKTTDGDLATFPYGPGIHVFHYKDPVVAEIVKKTRQQEILSKGSADSLLMSNSKDGRPAADSQPRNEPVEVAITRPAQNGQQIHPNQPLNQIQNGVRAQNVAPQSINQFQNGAMNGQNFSQMQSTGGGFYSEVQQVKHSVNPNFAGQLGAANSGFNEYKSVMEGKEMWRVGMMPRSQSSSSSSTTSR